MAPVVAIVRQCLPSLLRDVQPSVVCVRTTYPKFLVFERDSSQPACVVAFGERDRLLRVDRVLSELHHRAPAAVPRSLYCGPWGDGSYVQIQEGLPGMPWFRLADTIATPAQWTRLLDHAIDTMLQMHRAIAEVPFWVGSVRLNASLRDEIHEARHRGCELEPDVLDQILECATALGDLRLHSWWQHGDYSLNNLLVSSSSLAVIDYDEFGHTMMPLHDAFGLALSFPLSQGSRCPIPVPEIIARAIHPQMADAGFDDLTLRALLYHHLLWRINRSGSAARAQSRARLAAVLSRVVRVRGHSFSDAAATLHEGWS